MKEKFWLATAMILGSLLLVSLLVIFAGEKTGSTVTGNQTQAKAKPVVLSQIKVEPQPSDWGDLKINGGLVEKQFKIKNEGEAVKTTRVETSCMCTEASLNGSQFFGMPGHAGNPGFVMDLGKGEETTLIVRFDPAAHGPEGLGKVDRVVRIWFNQPENSYQDIAFSANVVK